VTGADGSTKRPPVTALPNQSAPLEAADTGPIPIYRDVRQIRRYPVLVATALALALGIAYLLAPLMGSDLSAQIARADFAGDHPLLPVDFRWFGGTLPFGYSLWAPALMAAVGVRLTGVLAALVAVAAFTFVLRSAGARRPMLGGAAFAITFCANLTEGRITFSCGIAAGLTALAALFITGSWDNWRFPLCGLFAIVAGAASPFAAGFLLLAAVAALARTQIRAAVALSLGVLPVAVMIGLFPDGSRQTFGINDAARAVAATAIVLAALPGRCRVLRVGAALGLVMVVLAYFLDTPIGSNATRLSLLFAIPVAVAFVSWRWWIDLIVIIAIAVAQPPVTFGTLTGAGAAVTKPAYFTPLVDELRQRGPLTGRVEVPELTGHWDSAYLARSVPLARGWLRQTDTQLNDDVFYRNPPTASTYREFLDRMAVQYVAVADARTAYNGRRENALIQSGLPYLSRVWSDAHWTLYAVSAPTPIVSGPGRLVSYGADSITFTAPANAAVVVRIRDFRWLSMDDNESDSACITRAGDHIVVHTKGARKQYTITSGLYPKWFGEC
jgi:hypothetical protein